MIKMIVAIVGASGSIGGAILHQLLRRDDITKVIAITRKPLQTSYEKKETLENIIISNFGDLDGVPDETWERIQTADALMWAAGTYNYDQDANLNYPLRFQQQLIKRLAVSRDESRGGRAKFRFILLGGALVETDQSRWLYFLGEQRRTKGTLQSKTLDLSKKHDAFWEAYVVRPAAILMVRDTYATRLSEYIFGTTWVVRSEELGAFVADLMVHG